MTPEHLRRVATYERVSSEDQKERETILTQTEELARRLQSDPDVALVERYVDDGFSGTIPMEERPAGKRLMQDARRGRFDEVWVFKLDRLGRDDIDPLLVRRELTALGIKLVSLNDNIEGNLEYAIRVAIAAEERRTFRARTAAGMARAARDGRYCGGIVPLGYKVEGSKQTAHLVVSDTPMWRTWAEAEVISRIFEWSAGDGWSCAKIAEQFNALGVPTAYQQAGRCVRKKRTRGEWTPGRIRQLLNNTIYKGVSVYGKRGKGEPIAAPIPAIVSEAVWDMAQLTLAKHRRSPKHAENVYLLRSIMICGCCDLHYSGTRGRGVTWYRCNGKITWRGRLKGECWSKGVDGRVLEPAVWDDVVRWLRTPSDLLDELAAEQNANSAGAVAEAERTLVESALADISDQRNRMLDLYRRGRCSPDEFEAQMDAIAEEQQTLERRLTELTPVTSIEQDVVTGAALREQVGARIDAGLSDAEKQEIIALLVRRITIKTEIVDGKKRATAVVEFRFPAVDSTHTGTGSSPPPA